MATSKARLAEWKQSWAKARERGEDPLQVGMDALKAWEADPLGVSALAYWLKLEVWSKQEGLLVLAGIEPDTVSVDTGDSWEFESCESIPKGDWINGQPFHERSSFSVFPVAHELTLEDFDGNKERFESYLQHIEHMRDVLEPHRKLYFGLIHKLAHSPSALGKSDFRNGWRPVAFIAWAKSIGFRPSWYEWAEKKNLLPDQLDYMAAPFFDADSESYPKLLHIAVRAWEAAQQDPSGTPKQRIERYLKQRHPEMTGSTRAAIALVANWHKAGGRPKQSE